MKELIAFIVKPSGSRPAIGGTELADGLIGAGARPARAAVMSGMKAY